MPLQTAFKRADAVLGNLCRKAIEGVDGAIEYPAPAILRPYFREIELVVLARPWLSHLSDSMSEPYSTRQVLRQPITFPLTTTRAVSCELIGDRGRRATPRNTVFPRVLSLEIHISPRREWVQSSELTLRSFWIWATWAKYFLKRKYPTLQYSKKLTSTLIILRTP